MPIRVETNYKIYLPAFGNEHISLHRIKPLEEENLSSAILTAGYRFVQETLQTKSSELPAWEEGLKNFYHLSSNPIQSS